MKNLLVIFLLSTALCAQAQTRYWQQQADHVIDVKLNTTEKTLDGFERITYTNNSPDTLRFIWFHLWPNAYKNDRTAFTEQQLRHGDTKFYFSEKEQRGYINRLDFKVGGVTAKTEDHPEHIDIIKVQLPQPLAPGQVAVITTPFHVKLPFNFSRGGYDGQTFQVTQWYPKPALYDARGWHPMPYLDLGEFYSEFGDYKVTITLPEDYVVAATGVLQEPAEKQWLQSRTQYQRPAAAAPAKKFPKTPVPKQQVTPVAKEKTLSFEQQRVHDFAWFANKHFIVQQDTCALPSGRVIDVATYFTPEEKPAWTGALQYTKDAVRFYSAEVGEYPHAVVSVVQGPKSFYGGMEYPTITVISPMQAAKELDIVIAHEVGHNWFQGILGTNERRHPWLDEGINSFYEQKYARKKYGPQPQEEELIFQTLAHERMDQPITTASDSFSYTNYAVVAYHKTARWMDYIEQQHGEANLRNAMQEYFQRWQFRHPQPDDFLSILQAALPGAAASFSMLGQTGPLPNQQRSGTAVLSPMAPGTIAKFLGQPKKNSILITPAIGFNKYDRFMIGGMVTNYLLPPARLQFLAAPLYATGSKEFNGIGKLAYHAFRGRNRITIGLAGLHFSNEKGIDSLGTVSFGRFTKITPSVRYRLARPPQSTRESWIEVRSFFIREKYFSSFSTASDGLLYASGMETANRYVNQLVYLVGDYRALYPYAVQLQGQQGEGWYRLNATGNYFFNYAKGGGASVRVFGAGFGYSTGNIRKRFEALAYQPKLMGVTGEEDFTYSNYFIGRSASHALDQSVVSNAGLAAQQIMIRDGGLKMRLDHFEFLQGRSERWVAAINLNTTLPKNIFPLPIPLRLFFDAGTYAEAWDDDNESARFLYVGGLQLSVFKVINIYAPIVFSKAIRENLKALPEQNSFARRLTFSIDIQNISLRQFTNNLLSF